jgi:hypothetical protein
MVMKLTYFAEQHLTDSQAGKFAPALEERLAAGEPLVQK